MFLGIILGALGGYLFPEQSISLSLVGELFLRVLTMLIVPVIIISMLAGIVNLKDSSSLGRLGIKAVVFYFCTTALAVLIGLTLVNVIGPGLGESPLNREQVQMDIASNNPAAGGLTEVAKNIIPKNVVQAASQGNVLGLIFFCVFLGIAILSIRHPGVEVLKKGIGAAFEAIIWMVDKVMLVAPIGVCSLVANLVGDFVSQNQLSELGSAIGWYTLTVASGLVFHGIVSLPLLAVLFRIHPLRFAKAMLPALSTAFSTASSAATLPITIDSLEHRAKVSNQVSSFVAPLGATVNMDGTAIYEAVAAVFIANMYGVDLTFGQQTTIFLTATFSAVGAAGIPGAGLIMMTLVLSSVGLPAEGIQLIVVVDRALDMLRTCLNVWGDSIGAAIIARTEGEGPFAFD